MSAIRHCEQCSQPFPEDGPEGLCPRCLAKVALGSEPGPPGATINVNMAAHAAPGARVPPDVAQLAAQFPQLEIVEFLGMGGMGIVYKARQTRLDRVVALKILPVESQQHPSFAERFSREAKALARLNHPGIITVHDFGQTGAYYYFVMEFVDGMNLRQLLKARSVSPRQALDLVAQICSALQFAHDEGVVHRDIKPENILVNKKGQVKIADFGLAKLLGGEPDTSLTMSQAAMGTFNYMAPEQRENAQKVDHRADIYSLGVVFYEMLTGELPIGHFAPPSEKVQVDVRLDEVVLKSLAKEPERRYQHASEVKTKVDTISQAMPAAPPPSAEAPQTEDSVAGPESRNWFSKLMAGMIWVAFGWVMVLLCEGNGQYAFVEFLLYLFLLAIHAGGRIGKLLVGLGWLGLACLAIAAWKDSGVYGMDAVLLCLVLSAVNAFRQIKRLPHKMAAQQLPPRIRRSQNVRMAVLFGVWAALIVGGLAIFPMHRTQHGECFFTPQSGDCDKIGLAGSFSQYDTILLKRHFSFAPQSWTAALKVYRANSDPAELDVTVPGLRADYRFHSGGTAQRVLTLEVLTNWLQTEAAVDVGSPNGRPEASQLMALFKSYENSPPAVWPEFLNLAKADLQSFNFAGDGAHNSFGSGFGFLAFLCVSVWLYLWVILQLQRSTFAEAHAEIESGRWTPPKVDPQSTVAFKVTSVIVIVVFLAIALAAGVGAVNSARRGEVVWTCVLGLVSVICAIDCTSLLLGQWRAYKLKRTGDGKTGGGQRAADKEPLRAPGS
jgi:predicted Ser/Thr protein kinase